MVSPGSNDPDTFTDTYNIPLNIFTSGGSILPGTVMVRSAGAAGTVTVASGVGGSGQPATYQSFGLLNNFIGGTYDELWGDPYIAVWQGFDSTYRILAPAFNPSGLSAAFNAATVGAPVPLYVGLDGRLCCSSASTFGNSATAGSLVVTNAQVIAYLLDYPTNGYIVVQLRV